MIRDAYSGPAFIPQRRTGAPPTLQGEVLRSGRSSGPKSPPIEGSAPASYIHVIEAMDTRRATTSPTAALVFDYGTFAYEEDLVSVPFSRSSVHSPVPLHGSTRNNLTILFNSRSGFWFFKVPVMIVLLGGVTYSVYFTIELTKKDSGFLISPIVLGIVDCMLVWASIIGCLKNLTSPRVAPVGHTA